jgi:hypothetical protein
MSTSLIRMLSRIANSGDPGEVARAELERQTKAKREKSRRLAPRRKPGQEAKATKVKTKAERRREVYAAVDKRSGGQCEAVAVVMGIRCGHNAASHDHFWGRAREESVESVWHLCIGCDRAKTNNRPDRAWWIRSFMEHAGRRAYVGQVAKCDRALALETAQHPASPGATHDR